MGFDTDEGNAARKRSNNRSSGPVLPDGWATFLKHVPKSEYCDGDTFNPEKLIKFLRDAASSRQMPGGGSNASHGTGSGGLGGDVANTPSLPPGSQAFNTGVPPGSLTDQNSASSAGLEADPSNAVIVAPQSHEDESTPNVTATEPDLNLILPRVVLPSQYNHISRVNSFGNENQLENIAEVESSFSFRTFAWAIQQKYSLQRLKAYLKTFDPAEIKTAVNIGTDIPGYEIPILFYGIERSDPELVRLLVEVGANVDQAAYSIPPLAYAIIGAENERIDPLEVIKVLLARGANPRAIPKDMWDNPLNKPKKFYAGTENDQDPQGAWCKANVRVALARTLNLSQRYFLNKADSIARPKARKLQFGQMLKLTNLLQAPFNVVGQQEATKLVVDQIFTQVSIGALRPLVLMFAGPSGHGKTELAMQIGSLLGVRTIRVDCTTMKYETDMFGSRAPYHGSEKGSTLNNFLADRNSERCIVFLDEFEKTTYHVRQALLLPLDSGKYDDRRTLKEIDCSKAIWIFATNHGEETILKFYNKEMKGKPDDIRAKLKMDELEVCLREDFIYEMGAPLTGRVSEIIPFFPFSLVEQAVIAHSFIQRYGERIRKPVDISQKELIGHIHLDIEDDGQVCAELAKKGYIPKLGARMLARVVENEVSFRLASAYQDSDVEVFEEMNLGPLKRFTVKLESGRILVAESGFTPFHGAIEDAAIEEL